MSLIVLPGDIIDIETTKNTKIGLGLRVNQTNTVCAYQAGYFTSKNNKHHILPCGKRYVPIQNDLVLGIVIHKNEEQYRVDIGGAHSTILSTVAFKNATRRNRPTINVGQIVYSRISVASKDMDPELDCIPTQKSELLGHLENGFIFKCSLGLCFILLSPNPVVLEVLGELFAFEIATGMNGRVWINAASPKIIITIMNCIKSSEFIYGLGLADEKDITVKGLEAIKSCCRVYLEAYTSILLVDVSILENFYGCKVIIADREFVEQNSDEMLQNADTQNVAFLVVGDPYGATTHTDLVTRAKSLNVPTKTIHNASIMNAVGSTGLSLYAFGQTVSIPFHTDTWKPTSFMEKIKVNLNNEFHTLLLLDIKVKEQSIENMARGRLVYEPARFMKVCECIEQLLFCESVNNQNVCGLTTICVGLARVGSDDQLIVSGTIGELMNFDFGKPLHSFILPGKMHFMEFEALKAFAFDKETFQKYARVHDH